MTRTLDDLRSDLAGSGPPLFFPDPETPAVFNFDQGLAAPETFPRADLTRLAKHYGEQTPAQAEAQRLLAGLESQSTDEIFEEGLHEFLSRYIAEMSALGRTIHAAYLSGDR